MNIEISYDNALLSKSQHDSMKTWHANMATQHAIAAEWHSEQSESLSKAIQNLPLDPEKIVTSLSAERGQSTAMSPSGTPSSSAPESSTSVRQTSESGSSLAEPASSSPRVIDVPLDPVKKADLIQILKDHEKEYGSFGKSLEEVVESILSR
jgi:hypothetical protein